MRTVHGMTLYSNQGLRTYSTSAGAGAQLAIVFISLGSHPQNSSGFAEKNYSTVE